MTLIPIEHPHRLASPAEAERFFRAAGQKRVSARGFQTSDPLRFEALVQAADPNHEHTISFEGGALEGEGLDVLRALTECAFEYFDLRTAEVSLRIWPGRTAWVHADCTFEAASAAVGAPITIGTAKLGLAEITIQPNGALIHFGIEAPSVATVRPVFFALTGARIRVARGFIVRAHADTTPTLVRFLTALRARVDAVLDLDVSAARGLTELYAGEKLDWQADRLLIDFPDGRIHGYLTTPKVLPADREAWLARANKALARADLL